MGQAYLTERCEQCGTLKVLVMATDGKGPRALRCLACDNLVPIKLPANAGWIEGELRPPR
jgi:phage FluMu protein Com